MIHTHKKDTKRKRRSRRGRRGRSWWRRRFFWASLMHWNLSQFTEVPYRRFSLTEKKSIAFFVQKWKKIQNLLLLLQQRRRKRRRWRRRQRRRRRWRVGEMATRDLFCARESLLCWRRNTSPLTASFFFNPRWVCQSTVINLFVKL